jgi:hypothetical protein
MSHVSGSVLRIHLNGVFRVVNALGQDVSPKSQKAQALLALLATSESLQRSRHWLQAHLWSDRGQEQASGSLRQALVQIKRAFGPVGKSAIGANRARVWLDRNLIEIVQRPDEEFLEGIGVFDPRFQSWLQSNKRGNAQTAIDPPPVRRREERSVSRKFDIACSSFGGDAAIWFNRMFSDALARHLREFFSADVHQDYAGRIDKSIWRIRLESFAQANNTINVRISVENPATQRQIWSDNRTLNATGGAPLASPGILRLLNESIQAIGDEFLKESGTDRDDADLLCRRAIRSFFDLTKDGVGKADDLFLRAYEIEQRGLFLAWRAQIKTVQVIERYYSDFDAVMDEGEQLASRALEIEPNNSMVLATTANAFGHLMKQQGRALELAKQSVLINQANPMAWWSLSSANAYVGKTELSYANALTARNLALLSPNRFWWDNQAFGPALLLGHIDKAKEFAEAAYARNRSFRSTLRYLIAISAHDNQPEYAIELANRLKALEPDFSIERLVNDKEYPASLLHRSPNIDLQKLKNLI